MVNALLGLNILSFTYYQLLNSIVKENAMYIQKRIKVLGVVNGKGTNLRRFWIVQLNKFVVRQSLAREGNSRRLEKKRYNVKNQFS